MKKRRSMGFTLVELVVVMVIIGILAVVAMPMYRNYILRARASEGKALVGAVASAERIYYSEYDAFLAVALINYDPTLGIDARNNTYFQQFAVTVKAGNSGYDIVTNGVATGKAANIQVDLDQGVSGGPTITVTDTLPDPDEVIETISP